MSDKVFPPCSQFNLVKSRYIVSRSVSSFFPSSEIISPFDNDLRNYFLRCLFICQNKTFASFLTIDLASLPYLLTPDTSISSRTHYRSIGEGKYNKTNLIK